MKVLSNTSPLIALAAINKLDVIFNLLEIEMLLTSEEVIEEIKDKETKRKIDRYIEEGKIKILPKVNKDNLKNIEIEITLETEYPRIKSRNPEQHKGEAAVIYYSEKLNTDFLLLDERAAKKVANKKGIKVLTHWDILKNGVEGNIISKEEGLKCLNILEKEKNIKYKNSEYYRNLWKNDSK